MLELFKTAKQLFLRYKVTIFFLVTYWVMNPILYAHFGNAYIGGSATENKWLVFLAGPFSFTEDFKIGTPFYQALADAALSGNFWITGGTILLVERIVRGNYWVYGAPITIGKSYLFAVCASYLTSALFFINPATQHPLTGTSIISLSLLATYFISYPWVVIRRLKRENEIKNQITVNALMASSSGVILFALYFYFVNPSSYLHFLGVFIFVAIYAFMIRRSVKKEEVQSN